ncbi:hypothetical protein R3P38DRAFT_3245859 [Favolaschia claudopus]|uniref:Uncharacterized protein n=1 Tax=Favolaschia claudopus TaxID=2862362 RepID=A0AAV9YZV9_9AGAR
MPGPHLAARQHPAFDTTSSSTSSSLAPHLRRTHPIYTGAFSPFPHPCSLQPQRTPPVPLDPSKGTSALRRRDQRAPSPTLLPTNSMTGPRTPTNTPHRLRRIRLALPMGHEIKVAMRERRVGGASSRLRASHARLIRSHVLLVSTSLQSPQTRCLKRNMRTIRPPLAPRHAVRLRPPRPPHIQPLISFTIPSTHARGRRPSSSSSISTSASPPHLRVRIEKNGDGDKVGVTRLVLKQQAHTTRSRARRCQDLMQVSLPFPRPTIQGSTNQEYAPTTPLPPSPPSALSQPPGLPAPSEMAAASASAAAPPRLPSSSSSAHARAFSSQISFSLSYPAPIEMGTQMRARRECTPHPQSHQHQPHITAHLWGPCSVLDAPPSAINAQRISLGHHTRRRPSCRASVPRAVVHVHHGDPPHLPHHCPDPHPTFLRPPGPAHPHSYPQYRARRPDAGREYLPRERQGWIGVKAARSTPPHTRNRRRSGRLSASRPPTITTPHPIPSPPSPPPVAHQPNTRIAHQRRRRAQRPFHKT